MSTTPTINPRTDTRAHWVRALLLAAVAFLLTIGSIGAASAAVPATGHQANTAPLTAARPAPGPLLQAVGSCGGGRCTLYFSKSETAALANGRVPAPPAVLPAPLKAAYYAAAYGHRWFAQQYANRGWCSGFRVSVYPWESQGYFGYACNWN
ncbi:hypothetical protein D1871_04750 [Nakamurella silvestris]|nr:hypothetical protein D1871_04750 [Nakamurella silvestris]